MKKILILFCALAALASCKESAKLMPNISGKAGEVVVMLDKASWNGELGDEIRETLGGDCPYFVMREPMYTLINVTPDNFTNLFNVHRNILYFRTDSTAVPGRCELHRDVWAQPQCVIQIISRDKKSALQVYKENEKLIMDNLEQAERNRVVDNAKRYSQRDISEKIGKTFGGSLSVPGGYVLRKIDDNFAWIEYRRPTSSQYIFLYRYPAGKDPMELDNIISKRDSVLKANVPGSLEGSYMITNKEIMEPSIEYVKFHGREFAQTRGWWEVEGDFMGGPFVSTTFYSKDGKDIICAEALLYHPKDEKRLEFRQIEALLYSWQWNADEEKTSEK